MTNELREWELEQDMADRHQRLIDELAADYLARLQASAGDFDDALREASWGDTDALHLAYIKKDYALLGYMLAWKITGEMKRIAQDWAEEKMGHVA